MSKSIYRTEDEQLIGKDDSGDSRILEISFDELFRSKDPAGLVEKAFSNGLEHSGEVDLAKSLPPIGDQEVWAAGVTYFRSRSARMEEAESQGGDVFYDKVYEAPRPELFFKATASRVRGYGDEVCIRSDSSWDVPEPELTLAISSEGKVFGYSIGNDMSSRSIEGENPLYLPQAKVYRGSCAIGPCLVVGDEPSGETGIELKIIRDEKVAFSGQTQVGQIKRGLGELAEFLFHSNEFPNGAYLMTGTGIVPDSDFTLQSGDEVEITIQGIGTLRNVVGMA